MPTDLLQQLARGTVQGVTFRSQLTPDFQYDPWAPGAPPSGASAWLMDVVRPTIEIATPSGPIVIAPYGPPEHDYGSLALVGSLATLVGAVVLIGWAARRLK